MLKKYRKNLLLILAAAVVLPLILALSFLLAPASEPEIAEAAVTPTIYWGCSNSFGDERTLTISDKPVNYNTNGSFVGSTRFIRNTDVPWNAYSNDIESFEIVGVVKPQYLDYWFYGLQNLYNFNFNKDSSNYLDTSETVSMFYAFCGCSYINTNAVAYFNTSKVTNMAGMFQNCSYMKTASLSWRTPNLVHMYSMFSGCENLKTVELYLNTSKVVDMQDLFAESYNVEYVDISSFDLSKMDYVDGDDSGVLNIFLECESLCTIILPPMNDYFVRELSLPHPHDWYDSNGNGVTAWSGMTGGGAFYVYDDKISTAVKVQIGSTVKYYPSLPSAFSYVNVTTGNATVTVNENLVSGVSADVANGKKVTLDLNGYVVSFNGGAGSVITVSGGNLTLNDSRKTISNDVNGKIIYGGVITGGKGTHEGMYIRGGGIYGNDGSTVFINGGTIYKNSAEWGGGVYMQVDSYFQLNGGSIVGNTAISKGGGLYLSDGNNEATINSGYITDNEVGGTADGYGGGVYVEEDGSDFEMNGGFIQNNSAKLGAGNESYGGGVFCKSTFNFYGGTIFGNKARRGGGVGIAGSSSAYFTLDGGIITDNRGDKDGEIWYTHGGGVYIKGAGIGFDFVSGEIKNNKAEYGGGVYFAGSNFDMANGAKITSNEASMPGGGIGIDNIYDNPHEIVLNIAGEVSGNYAGAGGCGISVWAKNLTLNINNGAQITGNYGRNNSYVDGGGIYLCGDDSTVNISGGSITDNVGSNGGGVYADRGTLNITGGEIRNNSCENSQYCKGGGVYVYKNATFKLSGNPVISGSHKSGETAPNNIYLDTDAKIAMSAALTSGADIGVTLASGNGIFTTGAKMNATTVKYFKSDSTTYPCVKLNGSEAEVATHYYGLPVWTWNDTTKTATVVFSCMSNEAHKTAAFSATMSHTQKTAATCTTNGTNTYTATYTVPSGSTSLYDNPSYTATKDYQDIAATGHKYGLPVWTWNDTTKTATVVFSCMSNEAHKTAALSATMSHTQKTAATCTANGTNTYTATYTVPSGSTSLYDNPSYTATKDYQDIAATGHKYGSPSWTWNDTTKTATVVFTCSHDSSHKTAALSATMSHTEKTAATCTAKGTNTYTATYTVPSGSTASYDKSSYSTTKDYDFDALGHSMKTVAAKAATCGAKGNIKYLECDRCHNYFSDATPPVQYANKSDVETAALEHVWVEQSDTATCTSGGTKTYNCSNAGCSVGTKTESSAALGHDVKHVNATAATCVNTGIAEHWYCNRDGCSIKGATYGDSGLTTGIDKVVPAKGHTYERTGYNGQPTWEWKNNYTEAEATFTCTECAVGVTEHTHTESATEITPLTVPATCLEDGLTTYTAKLNYNNKDYSDEVEEKLDAIGHKWKAEWTGWIQDGDKYTNRVTILCAHDRNHVARALGEPDNIIIEVLRPATCISGGLDKYTAEVTYDNETFTSAASPKSTSATGVHIPATEFTIDIPVTCTTDGSKSKHCTSNPNCTERYEVTKIDALGHDWEVTVTDGTVKNGYKAFDTFNLNGLVVNITCGNDASHNETFTGGTDTATVTYASGNCLHLGDSSVTVDTTLARYGDYSYTINGITVDNREAENVVWEYSSNNTDWTAFTDGAELTYDGKTYSVRVKFDAYENDDVQQSAYTVKVGEFKNVQNGGYSYTLTEHGQYSIADGSRALTVKKAQIAVGGESWISDDGAELMSGFVKEDGSKFYPVEADDATEVVKAVARFVDGTVTITYYNADSAKYTVSYTGNTASAHGKYKATAIFTLNDADNYEFVAVADATLNADGTITLEKEWYAAICDNGFKGSIAGWTFGTTASSLPALEKDAAVSLVLKRNGEQIGVAFNLSNYSTYVNSTMPVGNYTLEATVSAVTIDGVEYAGFTKTLTFTVSKAAFTVSNLSELADISTTYDGNLHIHQDFTPTAPLITAGEGVWVNYASLYGGVGIAFSHADWTENYYTAAQIAAMTENTLFIKAADNAYVALYKISALNYEEVDGSFNVEISKATYNMNGVTFPDGDFEYDKNPHSIYVQGTLPNGVTVSYEGNGKTNAKAEGYLVTAKFTGDSVNYLPIDDKTATLYIKKATYDMSGVTFPDGAADLQYDGNPHSIFISGKLPDGVTVEYDGNGKTNANASGYTVTAKFTGDSENYLPIDDMTATLYINKAEISLDVDFDKERSKKYNRELQSLLLVGEIPEQVEVAYSNNSGIYVDTYNATATLSIKSAYASNYKFAEGTKTYYEATLIITLGDVDMSGVRFESKTVTYTGKAYSLSLSGTLPAGVSYSYVNNEHVEADEYKVKVVFYHNLANYAAIDPMFATLTIKKADYDMSGVTFPDATVAYTGNAHSLSIRGIVPAGVTYEYENNSLTNVGSQLVTVKFTGDSKNYNPIDNKTATLKVVPASFGLTGISLEGATVNYDGNTHSLTVNGTLPEGVTVKYFVNIDGEEVEFNGATDANTYDVIAKFIIVDSVNYKAPHPLTAKLTIVAPEKTERPIEITEPTVTEISPTASGSAQVNDTPANAVLAEVTEKSEFPDWVVAVCFIAVEAAVMLGIGCYIAFGAYKRKKG